MRIYVGCSLTHAPEEFRESIEKLKDGLRSLGHEVLDFLGLTEGTPQEVYAWDIERCVGTCDLFIAVCDYPSTGLGYELAMALNVYNKEVLAVAHQDTHLTRLVQGIRHDNFTLRRFSDLSEVVRFVQELNKPNQMFLELIELPV